MIRRVLIFLGVVALVALAEFLHTPKGDPATPPYLTVFLIDGLSQPIFDAELQAGHLPAIQTLIEEGLYVKNGIAAFPSMTGYGYYPLLTGKDATTSGVLGLRWFDRTRPQANFRNYVGRTYRDMNTDFAEAPKTLFECFAEQHSYAANSFANRGVHHEDISSWQFAAAKYRERSTFAHAVSKIPWLGDLIIPDWFRAEANVLQGAIDDLGNRPKIQWITFGSPDAHHHIHGFTETYHELLRHIDGLIAKYREASAKLGLEEDRVYLIASDHGVVDVKENVDLRKVFTALNLSSWRGDATYFRDAELQKPQEFWQGIDVIVAVNGNTMNYVYLNRSEATERRQAIAEQLSLAPGIELVVSKAEQGVVRVRGRAGEGVIAQHEQGLVYSLLKGRDPLGYCSDGMYAQLCDGRPRTEEEWLEATYEHVFPYAVPRLYALMTQKDVGDFVVTAQEGFDLAQDYELMVGNYRGGHGGLRADQLRVPYVLVGKGVSPGQRQNAARAEDLGQQISRLVGCEH